MLQRSRQWIRRANARAAQALRRSILSSMAYASYLPKAPPIGRDATSRQDAARNQVAARLGRREALFGITVSFLHIGHPDGPRSAGSGAVCCEKDHEADHEAPVSRCGAVAACTVPRLRAPAPMPMVARRSLRTYTLACGAPRRPAFSGLASVPFLSRPFELLPMTLSFALPLAR